MSGWIDTSRYSVEVHSMDDPLSPTGKAYIVELLNGYDDPISDGVASTFEKALIEAFSVYGESQ